MWRDVRSLAQELAQVEASLAAPKLDQASLEQIYDHQYELHFGRVSYRRESLRNNTIFGRLLSMLLREEIDAEMFIAGNMIALKRFVTESGHGFQPNMLSGEKARARYNAFLRRSNRRYRRGLAEAATSNTELGRLRYSLALDEREIGDLFVRSAVIGHPISWAAAVESVDPSALWRDVSASSGAEYAKLAAAVGRAGVAREYRVAQLRAAVGVANGFETDLAERIGVREFSWQALADLIVRTYEIPKREDVDLSAVDGGFWH